MNTAQKGNLKSNIMARLKKMNKDGFISMDDMNMIRNRLFSSLDGINPDTKEEALDPLKMLAAQLDKLKEIKPQNNHYNDAINRTFELINEKLDTVNFGR